MSECEVEEELSIEEHKKVSINQLKNTFDVLENKMVCCGTFFRF